MGTWAIDAAHTDVSFSAKHMMITTVRGTFGPVEGHLTLDEADPTNARGEFRVAAASVSTGFEARDGHLRSGDFLDVEAYPWVTFVATTVERVRGARFRVTGDLTIRDVTRPVAFDVEYLGIVRNMQGGRHLGLTARATIDRKDWGLRWNMALEAGGLLVGEEIRLAVEIAADEVAEGAEAAA